MSLISMRNRLGYYGGGRDGRIVKDKLRSFHAALKDSYQAEWITYHHRKCRCLINPEKLNTDYDQKEISIDFKHGMKVGETFYWNRTNSHWIVFKREWGEESYFRSSIRRCDYSLEVNNKKYWTYIRGPVETKIDWRQKHDLVYNDLNLTLFMYITKNEETNAFFKRFQIVKFDGHNWQVTAVDRYSQDGLIECTLEEYFDNVDEDNKIPPLEVEYDEDKDVYIDGPQVVGVYDTGLTYTIKNYIGNGTFTVNSDKIKIVKSDSQSCIIDVLTGKTNHFKLVYNDEGYEIELFVTIESL